MFTLRIWVFKSDVLKNVFILSKHGTKANIRSTKMANNRHAYDRDVLQSYWTSDGLPLYCSQPTGEKTHTNQHCERLTDKRLLGSQCCLSTGLAANDIRLTKRCNALSLPSYVTRGRLDLGKSFTMLVCVCFLTSRLTTV
jgi:hypothetical protein